MTIDMKLDPELLPPLLTTRHFGLLLSVEPRTIRAYDACPPRDWPRKVRIKVPGSKRPSVRWRREEVLRYIRRL